MISEIQTDKLIKIKRWTAKQKKSAHFGTPMGVVETKNLLKSTYCRHLLNI
jgi:hypothetical protein